MFLKKIVVKVVLINKSRPSGKNLWKLTRAPCIRHLRVYVDKQLIFINCFVQQTQIYIYLKARAKFVSGPMAMIVSSSLCSLASLVIALTACSFCNRLVLGSSVKTSARPSVPWKFEPSRSCSKINKFNVIQANLFKTQ